MSESGDRLEPSEPIVGPGPGPAEPVDGEQQVESDVPSPEHPAPTRSRRGRYLIIGGAILAALVAGIVAVVAIISSVVGDPHDALRALPQDTDLVVNADLFQLRDVDSYDALLDALAEVLREEGEIGAGEDPIDTLVTAIEADSGIDVREDVVPWIGRSIAIGVSGDVIQDAPDFIVISLSVRSESKARAFITEVLPALDEPVPVDTIEVAGHEAFLLDLDGQDSGYLAITDGLVVLGASEEALASSLATLDDGGESILDNPRFATALERAPGDAWINIYVDGRWIEDTATQAFAELEEAGQPGVEELTADIEESLASLQSVGIWGTIADNAITVEAWVIGDELGLLGTNDFSGIGDDVLQSLPRDTFLVMGGGGGEDDAVARAVDDFSANDPAAMAEVRQASVDALGFDIFDELLAGLGNHLFVAILGDDGSLLAGEGGVGFVLGAALSDAVLVGGGVDKINEVLRDDPTVELRTEGTISELVTTDCGQFEFLACTGWVSAEFPVFENENGLAQSIAGMVDRYGREVAVVAVFGDGDRRRELARAIGKAWGLDADTGIVVVVDLEEPEVFVWGGPTSGVDDPELAERPASFRLSIGDLTTAMNLVLTEIDAQLADATAGETLGGRMPDDAFALTSTPVFAYGIVNDRLYVASSAAAVSRLGASGPSLLDNPSLGAITAAMDGAPLVLFGDLTTLEEIGALDPGTLPLTGDGRMAFGAGITREEGAVGFRMVFAIIE